MWFPQTNTGQKNIIRRTPGFKQRAYYEEAGKYKYHLKEEMSEKQAYKQVSVKAGDRARNTTDVPTNVMFPAHMNKIVLPEKRF